MKCWNIFSGHAGQYWNMIYPNDGEITDSEAKRYLSEITCGNNRDFNAAITYNDNKVIISSINRYFSAGVAMETKHIIVAQTDKGMLENRYSNILSFGFAPGNIISNLYNNQALAPQVARGIPDVAENFSDVEVNQDALREILYAFVEKIRLGEDRPVYIVLPVLNNVQEYIHFCKAVINRIISSLPIGLIPKTSFSIFPSQKDNEYSFVFIDERDGSAGSLRIDRPVNLSMEDKSVQYMVDIFINNPNLFEKIDDRYDISELTVSKYMDFLMLYLWQNGVNVDISLLKEWSSKLKIAHSTDAYYETSLESTINQCLSRAGFTAEALNRMMYDDNVKTYEDLNNFLASYSDILAYLASNGISLSVGLLESYYNNIMKSAESVFGNGEQLFDNVYRDFEDNKSNIEKCFSVGTVNQIDALLRNGRNISKSKEIMLTVQKAVAYANSFAEVVNILDDKSNMYQEVDIKIDGQTMEDLVKRLITDRTSVGDWGNGVRALADYENNRGRLEKYLEKNIQNDTENYVDCASEEFYRRCTEEGIRQVKNFSRRDQHTNLLCKCGELRKILAGFDIANNIVEKYIEYICSSSEFDDSIYQNSMEMLEQFQRQPERYGVDPEDIERIKGELRQKNDERFRQFGSSTLSLKREEQQSAAGYSNYNGYRDDQILRGDGNSIPLRPIAAQNNMGNQQEPLDKKNDDRRSKIIKIAIIAGIVLAILAVGALVGFFIGKSAAKKQQKGDAKDAVATSSDADSRDDAKVTTEMVSTEETTSASTVKETETEVTTESITEKSNLATSTEDTENSETATEDNSADKASDSNELMVISKDWKDGKIVAAFTEISDSIPMKEVISRMQKDQITVDEYRMLEQYIVVNCIMNDDDARQDDILNAVYIKCCPDIAAYIEDDASYVTYPIVAISKNDSQEIDVYYFDGDEYVKADRKDLAELDVDAKLKNGSSPNPSYGETIDNTELNKTLNDNFSELLKVFND